MAEALNVKVRDTRGKRNSKRLRRNGAIPAVLYGHKEDSVSLAVSADEMAAVLRHGGRVVDLKGPLNEKALIRDLQWDTYGIDVIHIDFARVSEHERIHVEVPVELRGQAPGTKEGGIVELLVHELEIECEAISIPEKIEINVNDLHLGGELLAKDLPLPQGVKLLTDPETVLVHCVEPMGEEELAAGEAAPGEPEIIGRKAEE